MNMVKQLKIHSGSRYELQLKSGELLPAGRTRYKQVKGFLVFWVFRFFTGLGWVGFALKIQLY
jgi:hypothetical protein